MKLRIFFLLALLCLMASASFAGTAFTLSSNPNPSLLGQTVTFTAGPAPSGNTVTFRDGGVNGTPIGSATSFGSNVSIQVSNLTAGNHSIIACYPVFNSTLPSQVCTNTVVQVVGTTSTSTSLSLSPP